MAHSVAAQPANNARTLKLAFVLTLAAALISPVLSRAATGDPVLINEVLVSHTGTPDDTEFLELYGTPGASLAGFSLLVVEGDSGGGPGTVDRRLDFDAAARLGGNGFFLVGNPTGLAARYNVVPDVAIGNDWFENGSQTLALAQTGSLGSEGAPLTGGEVVFDAVGLADNGSTDAWFFGAPVVGPDDGFLAPGARRVSDGVDTDTSADWVIADDLLGGANTPTAATPFDAPPPPESAPPQMHDLATMLDGFVADGAVAGSKAHQLRDRLERISRFSDGGQQAATAAQLRAFVNQVRGLSPRWVTADAAEALATVAQDLAAALSS